MHATKALEYLVLNASDRIDYRVKNGISLQQWYESFKPQPIQGEDMNYRDVCEHLEIFQSLFYSLYGRGYFGGVPADENRKRVKVSEINRILEHESYLIPVSAFYGIIEEQQYHMSRRTFYDKFKKYYEHGMNNLKPCVSVSNAAKIFYELQKRKIIVEEWPTLEDFNRDSGLNMNTKSMQYCFKLITRGMGVQPVKVQ